MLAGPDEVVFEEAGIKVSGTPALCLPTLEEEMITYSSILA